MHSFRSYNIIDGGFNNAVSAYTKSNFSCTATKLMDGESTHIKKYAGSTKAETTVSSMTKKGKSYEMWVEKGSTGTNVTFHYGFTNTCTKRLPYNRPAYQMIHMMQIEYRYIFEQF